MKTALEAAEQAVKAQTAIDRVEEWHAAYQGEEGEPLHRDVEKVIALARSAGVLRSFALSMTREKLLHGSNPTLLVEAGKLNLPEVAELLADAMKVETSPLMEARARIKALENDLAHFDQSVGMCTFCGQRSIPVTEGRAHMLTCPKHPIAEALARVAELEAVHAANDEMIGALQTELNEERERHMVTAEERDSVQEDFEHFAQVLCGLVFDVERQKTWVAEHSTCAFCGKEDLRQGEVMQAHAASCDKHPMAALAAERDTLRALAKWYVPTTASLTSVERDALHGKVNP